MDKVLGTIQAAGAVVITRSLDLGDFDEAYQGATFEVWVAPSRGHLQEWQAITEKMARLRRANQADQLTEEEKRGAMEDYRAKQLGWYATVWRNISLDEARQIKEALPEVAWDWLMMRSSQMIGEFRKEKMGNSGGG